MNKNHFSAIIMAFFITGCSHTAVVSSARPTNVYSSHDQKIATKVSYTVDETSLSKLKKDDAVSGFQCSAHRYPVDASSAFLGSIPSMLETVFDEYEETRGSPEKSTPQFVFRIERFEPRVKFNQKFFSADADATVELAVSVVGTLDGKRIFGTSADTQRNSTGDAGSFCSGAGEVLADATSDAIKDVLEKIGERLANNNQLRNIQNNQLTSN